MPKYTIRGKSRRNGITFYEGNTAFRYSNKTGKIVKIPFFKQMFLLQFGVFNILYFKFKEQILTILGPFFSLVAKEIDINNLSINDKIYYVSFVYLITLIGETVISAIIGRFSHVFKVHSAEHKVLIFYQENGRVPSLEQARKQSPFSRYCGSTYVALFICILTASVCLHSIGPYMPNEQFFTFLYVLGILLASRFFYFLKKKTNFMCFLQIFVLQKPDDKTLECACDGLQAVINQLDKRKRKA